MINKSRAAIIGLLLALGACSPQDQVSAPAVPPLAMAVSEVPAFRSSEAIASSPDQGALVNYDRGAVPQKQGAFTSHRVDVSEDHALRAIVTGNLSIPAPDGEQLQLKYERHAESSDGNWTWVGRLVGGDPSQEAIITFGEKAVFGSIPQRGGRPELSLTTRGGALWVVETDPRLAPRIDRREQDTLVPLAGLGSQLAAANSTAMQDTATSTASSTTSSTNTIDVLLGYTTGFAAKFGGQSQAVTRLTHLVEINNQAYANSQINGTVRLVGTQQVDYTDGGTNKAALTDLTGSDGSKATTVPASLQALRAARDTLGADLVALVRAYEFVNDGCGIAWLLGAGQRAIVPSQDAVFGYSVVSNLPDGTSAPGNDGKNYFCSKESLAHEMGHLMGSAHDIDNSKNDDGVVRYGRYVYSFGAKADATAGNFFTIMSYGDGNQTAYRVFSNPNISTCGGFACGVANQADNVRSLNQTIPVVSGFRASVTAPVAKRLNLRTIAKLGGTGTEVHELSGAAAFQSFSRHSATALHQTGSNHGWEFQFGDYNRDGVKDLYSINKNGASGRTEVNILNGQDNYSSFVLRIATALHPTGVDSTWVFRVGHFNSDGIPDIYVIGRQGASGTTEVHVLDGATNYQTYLAHIATALHRTGGDGGWNFELGDFNRDGKTDIYVINKGGASSTTEVHVLNGATSFQSYLAHIATALHPTGTDHSWTFKVGDYNLDGAPDIYVIARQGRSLRTEVHVLDGATNFQSFSAHIATALHQTGSDGSWAFELVEEN